MRLITSTAIVLPQWSNFQWWFVNLDNIYNVVLESQKVVNRCLTS